MHLLKIHEILILKDGKSCILSNMVIILFTFFIFVVFDKYILQDSFIV